MWTARSEVHFVSVSVSFISTGRLNRPVFSDPWSDFSTLWVEFSTTESTPGKKKLPWGRITGMFRTPKLSTRLRDTGHWAVCHVSALQIISQVTSEKCCPRNLISNLGCKSEAQEGSCCTLKNIGAKPPIPVTGEASVHLSLQ